MATLEQELASLADAVAVEFNSVRIKQGGNSNGDISTLTTTNKGHIVGAVNEIDALAKDIDNRKPNVKDDNPDAANNFAETFSTGKIISELAKMKTDIVGGASGAYDTLVELQDLMAADDTQASAILAEQSKRIAVNSVQLFTDLEKAQARANLGSLGAEDVYAKSEVFSKAELGDLAIALAPYFQSKLGV